MSKKINIPINDDIPDFKFPNYTVNEIDERVTLISYPDKTDILSGISILFSNGASYDTIDGLAYFTSQLMKRGTNKRTSSEIAEEIDNMGAVFNASAHWDFSSFGIISLSGFLDKAVNILFDCVLNPIFPENEIQRYKIKHIADIEQELADPSYIGNITLNNKLFFKHPYGHPLIGMADSINGISRDDCRDFHKILLTSEKIFIITGGQFDEKKVIKLIANKLKYFPDKNNFNNDKPKIQESKKNKLIMSHKSNSNQTTLKIAKFSLGRDNQDFPALQFINTIFGGFFLSRLNELLRQKLGYTYGVKSYLNPRNLASTHNISTSVNKKATSDTIMRIIEQMNIISQEKISDTEYHLSRQYFLGSFLRSLETTGQVISLIRSQIISNLPNNYFDDFFNQIKNLDPEKLLAVQKKCMRPEGLVISAVGNSKFLSNELSGLENIIIEE